ncbi:hypothetical protein HBH56_138620 [Parastagonospora nodorum]|uniref:Zn(2)-C6 fungal-type domain-containing protein n=2 Tax=Phaeosphaeria nodorum (strain SN15 / ATCC MYA-4574 / FGSC 10173) TaxID=321614 RepID=A0A7U2ERN6_PHANO|nr:hypothetical protein SNOG_00923 [Parastagonospora nodorum SN15]KAH3910955.1 hypothetical protein HBH56_138620 [Parastagonospora nodorum]EAT92418.1 hypothetical protein SNOG_00923 [Parastagonospora nodorum SN15]KAH3927951.1 hypothetical protein HBH54_143760 [Parastagonospora nodorum]KAH3948845.1 hypothetical protein HBH53_093760 [Parastagonospora nodorum]KAH4041660.1 hypothetical protein HBI09_002760 [Parastagonospora nodorum]
MLGYISSTRKKSCFGCVKAKRRCDLGYPFCKRCGVKGHDCKYPNASPREKSRESGAVPAEVVIRQSTPDLGHPLTSAVSSCAEPSFINISTCDASLDPLLFQTSGSSGSSSSPESFEEFTFHDDWDLVAPRHMPRAPLTRMLLPEIVVPTFLSQAQTQFITYSLQSFVSVMAYQGSTAFLHKDLYETREPEAIQDCVAISALYMSKSACNQRILANTIATKISALTHESQTWTLTQHLAAVQALIIYQIIRLYDPDLNLQHQAASQLPLLEHWTATLWKRSFAEPQTFASDYASWIFHESLRRTIMISVFVRCGYSCLTRDGLASQVPVVARLPLTKDLGAWNCSREEWEVRPVGWLGEEDNLVSYGEFGTLWSLDRDVGELDAFGRLLIAACRGKEDARLLA